MENKLNTGDLFTNGETTEAKPHRVNLSLHSREFTITTTSGYKKRNLSILYQPTVKPLPQYSIGLVL